MFDFLLKMIDNQNCSLIVLIHHYLKVTPIKKRILFLTYMDDFLSFTLRDELLNVVAEVCAVFY